MALSALVTTASNLVNNVLHDDTQNSSPPPQQLPPSAPSGTPSSAYPLAVPKMPSLAPIPIPIQAGTSVVVPFSAYFATAFSGPDIVETQRISAVDQIAKMIRPWRDVSVFECEATIYPRSFVNGKAITIELAWSPSNVTPTKDNLHNFPTWTSFTCGTYNMALHGTLPLDLSYANPVIKSPIPYLNDPRLTALIRDNGETPDKNPLATINIRGRLICSNPLATPW